MLIRARAAAPPAGSHEGPYRVHLLIPCVCPAPHARSTMSLPMVALLWVTLSISWATAVPPPLPPPPAATLAHVSVRRCIPDTLGSEYLRKEQTFNLTKAGRIVLPEVAGKLCLTATGAFEVQWAPGITVEPCSATLAANQTWRYTKYSQIVLAATGHCIDVKGAETTPGTQLHTWACVQQPHKPCDPKGGKCIGPNQQFAWETDGSVRSLMSGEPLCIDASSTPPPRAPKTCDQAQFNGTAYCDRSASAVDRAAALVSAAHLSEQISNLGVKMAGLSRLGVPSPSFGEALHGVCIGCATPDKSTLANSTGCATSFPHAMALASTFNSTLWSLVGTVIGREARALYNVERGGNGATLFVSVITLRLV